MAQLPVKKLWGVGPKSNEKFQALGIENCGQLQAMSSSELIKQFGKWGHELYHLSRGEDDRAVVANRPRKSLSNERTYADLLQSYAECRHALKALIQELRADWKNKTKQRPIRKVFVKVKFSDFSQTSKERVCDRPTPQIFYELLEEAYHRKDLPVRLLGAGVRFDDPTTVQQRHLNF